MRARVALLALVCLGWPVEARQAPTRLQRRGAVLKAYRTGLALTQAQLATSSGLTATKVSRIERGLDSATVAQENAVARALDSLVRLRFGEETIAWVNGIALRLPRKP